MADLSMPTRPGDSDPDMDQALRRARQTGGAR
jgi:hypothetical protein